VTSCVLESIAQTVAHPIFCQNERKTFTEELCRPENLGFFVVLKTLPEVHKQSPYCQKNDPIW
jgi:hypothetical protein